MENLQQPIELAPGVYWLGMRSDSRLEVNVYLRMFEGNGKKTNIIIDPGPPIFFERLYDRVKNLLGDPPKIAMAFINHQDPDVGTNAMFLRKRNTRMRILCTEDTWRLAQFLGLNLKNFQSTDKFKNSRGRLSTGQVVRFITTPFCHFRGCCMLYDEDTRILFSGDLFGGLSFSQQLFATPDNWNGMRIFHQIYMPSREAVRYAIEKIRRLKPAPLMIAPQHGNIIQEAQIPVFLEKLYDLPVGLDLLQPTIIDKEIYLQAINEILTTIRSTVSPQLVAVTLKQFASDGSFPSLFTVKNGQLADMKEDNIIGSIKTLIEMLMRGQSPSVQATIKLAVMESNWNLPIFDEEEEEEPEEVATDEFFVDDDIHAEE